MQIVHRIQSQAANGQNSLEESKYDLPLTLGKGGGSTLIINKAELPIEAFRLEIRDSNLYLIPLSEKCLPNLNSAVLREGAKLQEGDQISIASLLFKILKEKDGWILWEERLETQPAENSEEKIERQTKKLSLESGLPSILVLSLAVLILLILSSFLLPLLGYFKKQWSSGELSNKHQMIAHDCKACHQSPFLQVQDQACLSCHKMSEHAQSLKDLHKDKAALNFRCAECHMDHNGDAGLKLRDSRQCTQCHATLQQIRPGSDLAEVDSFDNHPEFSVTLALRQQVGNAAKTLRVRLDKKELLKDPTHLKLNHQLHLKPNLRTINGIKNLECKDCHLLKDNFREIVPITFEKNCQSCHPLEFDERLTGNQVPHASPDTVYNYLYAEYAKLLLALQDNQPTESKGFGRFRPGEQPSTEARAEYVRKYVEAEARVAERLLFTRTACQLCHDVSERTSEPQVKSTGELSRFELLSPEIPQRWMPASIFSHGAHEELQCEACHTGAKSSELTSDVLLPGVTTCQECHADLATHKKVASDCSTCHSYHDSQELPADSKRALSQIVLR